MGLRLFSGCVIILLLVTVVGLAWSLVIMTWSIPIGVRAHWAQVLLPCLPGSLLSVARLMCVHVDLTVSSAGPLLPMLTSACALSGAALLTASFTYQGCIDLPEGSAYVDVERGFPCYGCGCALATVGAWRTNRARVHGARHPARALAFGSMCSGCCMEFHTRPRLLWHLMYSVSSCLGAYVSFFAPCDDATVVAAEHSDRVESRALRRAVEYDRVARLPAVRVHGCKLPPAAHGFDSLKGVLPPRVPAGPDDCGVRRAPVTVHRYLDVTVYYVLHFFSGQRRPGDFQDWLNQALAVTHYPVWVIISLGVAVDAKLCDLSCSGGVPSWLDLAIAGRVVMVLGGPPCETWSDARWNGGSRATGSWPRAVRSSLHLWGLHDLDAGERQQVALGNALMRTVILFLTAARVYGFAAVMEHPQLPSWMPQAPSSWKLPELKLLARAGGTVMHLDQCCCGTPWKKPTRLFAVGIPELGRRVAKLQGGGKCCPALGHKHVSLSGKTEGGVCRTAPAKTYNSVMCKVLADATFGGIARFLSGHVDVMAAERGLPPEIAMLHVPIDHYDPESWTAWAHDCARAPT